MTRRTLSTLIPNYNHAKYLPQAIESVLAQSRQPDEILIQDDASTDDSVDIIQRYLKLHPHIQFFQNPKNLGVTGNLGLLISRASGDFVHALAADDYILPEFYEHSMALLEAHPQAALCVQPYGLFDETTGSYRQQTLSQWWSTEPAYLSPDTLESIPCQGWIQGHTVVMSKKAYEEAGGFISELKWYSDWFFDWVMALRHGLVYLPEPLAVNRHVPGQFQAHASDWKLQKEVIRAMLSLLRKPAFADVYPRFRRAGVLAYLNVDWVARVILESSEFHAPDCFELMQVLYRKRDEAQTLGNQPLAPACKSLDELRKLLEEPIQQWITRQDRVLIYGAGEQTSYLFRASALRRAPLVAVVDQNSHYQGKRLWDLDVIPPERIPEFAPTVILISSTAFGSEIRESLRDYESKGVAIFTLY